MAFSVFTLLEIMGQIIFLLVGHQMSGTALTLRLRGTMLLVYIKGKLISEVQKFMWPCWVLYMQLLRSRFATNIMDFSGIFVWSSMIHLSHNKPIYIL